MSIVFEINMRRFYIVRIEVILVKNQYDFDEVKIEVRISIALHARTVLAKTVCNSKISSKKTQVIIIWGAVFSEKLFWFLN